MLDPVKIRSLMQDVSDLHNGGEYNPAYSYPQETILANYLMDRADEIANAVDELNNFHRAVVGTSR